jgi:formylglycine-generating enzyme required for sulfatase activity
VGQKKPNPWGLYDICGNVWQWCNDFYKVDYYPEAPKENPRGPDQGDTKIVRGGAWKFGGPNCRSGYRYNENPGYVDVCFGYDIYGFRCVRNAPAPKEDR